MKEKFIDYYMKMAELTAELSYAKRLQVGAVIVKNQQVIGTGYNGTPAGWDNTCEDKVWDRGAGGWLDEHEIIEGWPYEGTYLDAAGNEMVGRYRLKTKPEVLHAERNAIDKVAVSNESSKNALMFITHAPCLECSKSIYSSGISKVYYRNHYRSNEGILFLEKCGVEVTQIK
jgi:dCMP deaminase